MVMNGTDLFGVKMLNSTKQNGQDWFMNDLLHDERVDIDGQVEDQGNGVWKGTVTQHMHPPSLRIEIYTTSKVRDIDQQLELGKNWKKMEEKGYMVDENDFTNFEATIYFKVTEIDKDDEMSIYGRGGRHPNADFPKNCVSCCYKGQINTKGVSRWAKEYHHANSPSGYIFSDGTRGKDNSVDQPWGNPKFNLGGSILNKWIGQKVVMYNIQEDGKTLPKMQIYCDTEGGEDITKQNWRLMDELVDDGNLPKPQNVEFREECNAISDRQAFTWGGPYVVFRIDNVKVLFKNASVREITPPSS
jgi:hypothetical protein